MDDKKKIEVPTTDANESQKEGQQKKLPLGVYKRGNLHKR